MDNVDISDGSNRTPLHWAAAVANGFACRALLNCKANPAKLDNLRRTPLHWLALSDRVDSVVDVATLLVQTYPDLVCWQVGILQ